VNILTARNLRKKLTSGFTLVELLIVIGLLGAIALIVIAAINPIEQANRARDTRFKADAGQLISATDRYFAARSEFPWMSVTSTYSTDDSFGFAAANNQEVGLCGATCAADGVLITNDELKTEFRNRDFVQDYDGSDASETIWIGKESGSSASVYACFVPLSNSERQDAIANGNVYTISTADGTRTVTTSCDADTANWVTSGCYICIPE
jgi:prepilin-type N-terminal cleavage/methylation domain-containing protein